MTPLQIWIGLSLLGMSAAILLIAVTGIDLWRAWKARTNGDRRLAVYAHGLIALCALIGSGFGLWLVLDVLGDNPNAGGTWTRGVIAFVISNAAFTTISVVLVGYRFLLRRRE